MALGAFVGPIGVLKFGRHSWIKMSMVAPIPFLIALGLFPSDYLLIITAFFGFNSLTGSEPLTTAISNTSAKGGSDLTALEPATPVVPTAPVAKPVVKLVSKTPTAGEILDELEFANAQLESAAVMLETLKLTERDK